MEPVKGGVTAPEDTNVEQAAVGLQLSQDSAAVIAPTVAQPPATTETPAIPEETKVGIVA